MSSPTSRTPLERIVAEVRAQRPPGASERGLPPRLLSEFRAAASVARHGAAPAPQRAPVALASSRSSAALWLGLAAVLAAGALVIGRAGGPAPDGTRSTLPAPVASLDGRALDVGVLVIAADQARRIEHAGRASWVLAPGSAARLLSAAGGVLRVSLEQGSLEAEVQPSALASSFLVQARGTEVAVQGTRFGVMLIGEQTRVAVAQGRVHVRPLGQSSGTLLGAGMQADFAAGVLEPPAGAESAAAPPPALGAPANLAEAQHGPRPARPSAAGAGPGAPPTPRSGGAAPTSAPPSAAPPAQRPASSSVSGAASGASAEQALRIVTEHVQDCFRRHIRSSSELGIEASTRLGLWVEPNGELLRADFDPPLAPAVEACVAEQLAQVKVAPSPEGHRLERAIWLRR